LLLRVLDDVPKQGIDENNTSIIMVMQTLLEVARDGIVIPLLKVDGCLINRLTKLGTRTLLELNRTYLANMLIFEDLLEESFVDIVMIDVGRHQGESVVKLENHFRSGSAGRET
jgi:hypothetical protein